MKTAVMLIGFGGPQGAEEVRPFLQSVLKGVKIPQERFDEVLHHYEIVGNVSPYNSITYKQKEALEKELKKRKLELPVFVGFRHSFPSLRDTLQELKKQNIQKVAGFVLSSLRSYASFEKYTQRIEEAKKETSAEGIEFIYTEPFHESPLFIEAQADEITKVLKKINRTEQFAASVRLGVYGDASLYGAVPPKHSRASGCTAIHTSWKAWRAIS